MRKSANASLVAVAVTMGVTTNERLERLASLDLSNVRRKLMEPEPEGRGWSEQQALEAEKWYKRYLASIICFPDTTSHVPNGPIDFFWHQHILDTMAYGVDMEHVMGYFLHHYPYFGMNGDVEQRDDAFDVTNAIYRQMFGEDCLSMETFGFLREGDCAKMCKTRDSIELLPPVKGQNCNHGGSGTGCGQACSKKRAVTKVKAGCAAGCDRSGCGRWCGKKQPVRRTDEV